jgi:3-methyl-2-oxobutanoate hydroxymethyltransferase
MSEQSTTQVSIATLTAMKRAGEKFACLTAYDASFAAVLDAAGVDLIMVGDSLGMVVQGHDSTLPVRMEDMIYHSQCVARGSRRALRVVDMPYKSYDTPEEALSNATRLVQEGQAQMVKLEGGAVQIETVRQLTAHGIPVCGHLGLLPQSVQQPGGYRVQGRDAKDAQTILADATSLQVAGAKLLVVECVPASLGRDITQALDIPVIGIGAGPDCDAQVLVLYDMLGITPGKRAKFVKDFMLGAGSVQAAVESYVQAVKTGSYPALEHCY